MTESNKTHQEAKLISVTSQLFYNTLVIIFAFHLNQTLRKGASLLSGIINARVGQLGFEHNLKPVGGWVLLHV